MATVLDFTTGSGNGTNEVDLVDVAALMLLPITASMIFGIFTMQINVFGGYDFTAPIWTVGGASISAALLITLFADFWILGTNVLNDQTKHEQNELIAIGLALAAPLLYVFVPAFASLVQADILRLALLMYVSGAAVYVSYES
ncbi:hypothetical protein [Natrinema sp. 1APR25-10V2]|uniref:hypothetical protein n=1 Tax=Natrinema sp. 1APR25-10V2 TaxID=2951081 RepID=UPI0028748604|nr:hypothetical protein [Natrinema sp. 1APR25-10V2]MDS0475276.1 hypothetical protein [Natrinema sp. 1APR25-10V2]